MFPILRRNAILPFPSVALNGILKRAAIHCNFDLVLAHAFKRAALTNAFVANEKGLVKISPRVLKDIGDHSKNYHEKYVRLGDQYIAELMVEIKIAFISEFKNTLGIKEGEKLLASFESINVRAAAFTINNLIRVYLLLNLRISYPLSYGLLKSHSRALGF